MGRRTSNVKREELNRGAWTDHEDKILRDYIITHGEGKWSTLPNQAGLKRCGKSCRLRWKNYLRPGIKRGNISSDEEELIIRLHNLLGNRWSLIAGRLPGRTDNEIKNHWNSNLRKRLLNNKNKNKYKNNVCVIRTKAVRGSKAIILPHKKEITSSINHGLPLQSQKQEETIAVNDGSSLLGDFEFDFDRIQIFPELMDFDGLTCGNVISDEFLGDWSRVDDSSSQENLDLNRPFASYFHRDDENWLRDLSY